VNRMHNRTSIGDLLDDIPDAIFNASLLNH
jgi:hypothetical protein